MTTRPTTASGSKTFLEQLSTPNALEHLELDVIDGNLVLKTLGTVSYGWTKQGKLEKISEIAKKVEALVAREFQTSTPTQKLAPKTIQDNLKHAQTQLIKKVDEFGKPSNSGFFSFFRSKGNDSNVQAVFSSGDAKPLSSEEIKYLETKKTVETCFSEANKRVRGFTTPIKLQMIRNKMGPKKEIPKVAYLTPEYNEIKLLHRKLASFEAAILNDPNDIFLQETKEAIETILLGHSEGVQTLHNIAFAFSNYIQEISTEADKEKLKAFNDAVKKRDIRVLECFLKNETDEIKGTNLFLLITTLKLIKTKEQKNKAVVKKGINNSDLQVALTRKDPPLTTWAFKATTIIALETWRQGIWSLGNVVSPISETTGSLASYIPYGLSFVPVFAVYAAIISPQTAMNATMHIYNFLTGNSKQRTNEQPLSDDFFYNLDPPPLGSEDRPIPRSQAPVSVNQKPPTTSNNDPLGLNAFLRDLDNNTALTDEVFQSPSETEIFHYLRQNHTNLSQNFAAFLAKTFGDKQISSREMCKEISKIFAQNYLNFNNENIEQEFYALAKGLLKFSAPCTFL